MAACRDSGSSSREPLSEAPAPPVVQVTPDEAAPTVDVRPVFRDVAKDVGIDFTFFNDEVEDRYFLPEVMGGGAAWLDFDLDGRLDLYLVNGARLKDPASYSPEHVDRLFRNTGGRFDDVTTPASVGHGGFGQGCCVGDFDADGFPDLYVCNFGPNALFKNNGDGTFQDVTDAAAVGDPLWGSSPVWVDLNDDALLDLFVTNYLVLNFENHQVCEYHGKPGYCGPGAYEAAPDRAYLNNGDGAFTEAAEALGLSAANGKGLAVAVADFDGDARPEIYVANDMAENFLYRRVEGASAPRYENIAGVAGCSVADDGSNEASMGVACSDFDGDGLVDIFLTHYYSSKNTLYRNLGGLLFADESRRSRIAATSFHTLGFGTVSLDYDRDGSRDLFVANGHVLGPLHTPNAMKPQLLHNDGAGRFDDVSQLAGPYFEDQYVGRGAAGADYDDDGDLDLAVTHLHRPFALLRNDTQTESHFIGLDLVTGNRTLPCGARVVVAAGERKIVAPVVSGGSYLSDGDRRIMVGLGAWDRGVDLEVHWPSGTVDRFHDLSTDRYWRIPEGGRPDAAPAISGRTQ
ncbi:MAG: CRTAC1 family protein [Planctomycetes bacterium]|nr:CRTAC1 family protein [Planctomycetota bacterium]